jgi:hypothetical protein
LNRFNLLLSRALIFGQIVGNFFPKLSGHTVEHVFVKLGDDLSRTIVDFDRRSSFSSIMELQTIVEVASV